MNSVVKDALRTSFLDVQHQHAETIRLVETVHRLSDFLLQELKLGDLCRQVVRIIIEETQFDNCSILLWDAKKGYLSLKAAFGLNDLLNEKQAAVYHQDLCFTPSEEVAGKVFATRSAAYIEDSSQNPIPAMHKATVHPAALACLPLLDVGVLNVSSLKPCRFQTHTRLSWSLLSKIIGYLISKASREPAGKTLSDDCSHGALNNTGSDNTALFSEHSTEKSPHGICFLDSAGCVIWMNKSMERLHGENVMGIMGRSPAAIFRDPQLFLLLMQKVADSDEEEMPEVSLVSSEGSCYLANVYLRKLTSADGSTTGYVLTVDEITNKVASLKRHSQSDKLAALGTMAGGVAHDFNNLLMTVLGNLQLILPLVTNQDARDRLHRIEKAAQDGARTVRRLQRFTERERELVIPVEGVSVAEEVEDVVEMTRPHWKNLMEKDGRTIEVQMQLEPSCFAAISSADLREVLTNLIFNAIEAMPHGGLIDIRSSSDADFVIVEVTDTGVGISEQALDRIFDPFFSTKGTGNSGLGLSVSWGLIVQCRGEIQVRSKPGLGTTFTIKLPKAEPRSDLTPNCEAMRSAPPHRVLLIEDDSNILGILSDMLRLKGHHVTATNDGEQALKLIQGETFDLVITDLGMPVVSGWDIAKHVKRKQADTPVVVITGWGAQYENEDLSEKGIDLVLSKPLRWEKLLDAVDMLVNRSGRSLREPGYQQLGA